MIHPYLEERKVQLIDTCHQYGIKSLYAFGSVVRQDFSPLSDVDFLVEYKQEENDPIRRFEIFLELKERMEMIVGRKVDILQEKDLTNPYLKHFILQEKEKIYAEA
jgi:predicted nucleotidyltransferase